MSHSRSKTWKSSYKSVWCTRENSPVFYGNFMIHTSAKYLKSGTQFLSYIASARPCTRDTKRAHLSVCEKAFSQHLSTFTQRTEPKSVLRLKSATAAFTRIIICPRDAESGSFCMCTPRVKTTTGEMSKLGGCVLTHTLLLQQSRAVYALTFSCQNLCIKV